VCGPMAGARLPLVKVLSLSCLWAETSEKIILVVLIIRMVSLIPCSGPEPVSGRPTAGGGKINDRGNGGSISTAQPPQLSRKNKSSSRSGWWRD
jgi:hypothetical protein